VPDGFPLAEQLPEGDWADGGSAIAGPDGTWLREPVAWREGLVVADIDLARVREERQNFDPTGHYGRPDVFELHVDRRRLAVVQFEDGPGS
jgi:nitrilase